jgi:hypothetical protein
VLLANKPEGGAASGKEIGEGALGKSDIFLNSPREKQRSGLRSGWLAGGGARRRTRARRRAGSGGIERGGRGRQIPLLTSGRDGPEREIDGRRQAAAMAVALRARERGEVGRGAVLRWRATAAVRRRGWAAGWWLAQASSQELSNGGHCAAWRGAGLPAAVRPRRWR